MDKIKIFEKFSKTEISNFFKKRTEIRKIPQKFTILWKKNIFLVA